MSGWKVSGGSVSVEARYDDMLRVQGLLDKEADTLREVSGKVAGVAHHHDVLEAAVLAPDKVAEVEAKVLSATILPGGALLTAVELELTAKVLATAVHLYRWADRTLADIEDHVDHAIGWGIGRTGPGSLVAFVAALQVAAAANGQTLEEYLWDHPWVMDQIMEYLPGLVQGEADWLASLLPILGPILLSNATDGNWPTTDYEGAIAGLIAFGNKFGLLEDSGGFSAVPSTNDVKPHLDGSITGIHDLMHETYDPPRVLVTIVGSPPNQSYIVTIPGTDGKSWSPTRGDKPNDGISNLHLMTQEERTNMERLVLQAMKEARIPAGAPVMLAGHSQGGIIAASLASDGSVRGQYNIRAIVTEGAPIGRHKIPEDIHVLAIENAQDVVPKLDGEDNPSTGNHTTVKHDLGDGSGSHVLEAHDGERYGETVSEIDRGTGDQGVDSAVQSFKDNTQEFSGNGTTQSYDLKRP